MPGDILGSLTNAAAAEDLLTAIADEADRQLLNQASRACTTGLGFSEMIRCGKGDKSVDRARFKIKIVPGSRPMHETEKLGTASHPLAERQSGREGFRMSFDGITELACWAKPVRHFFLRNWLISRTSSKTWRRAPRSLTGCVAKSSGSIVIQNDNRLQSGDSRYEHALQKQEVTR